MARTKKPRKPYRGRDSAQTPQTIRIEAEDKSAFKNWWEDNKQTVLIRLALGGLILLLLGLISLVWSLLS